MSCNIKISINTTDKSIIRLQGISFRDGDIVQQIADICHKYKHLYLEGYPCGSTTRKTLPNPIKKWDNCPGICLTYYITNDNDEDCLTVHVIVSDLKQLLKDKKRKLTMREIDYFVDMYLQNVAEEISQLPL